MSDHSISLLRQRMIEDMTARRFKEKVQRQNGKNAFPDLVSSGTADSIEAAKAAALHVAETTDD